MTQCFMPAKFAVEQFYLKHNSDGSRKFKKQVKIFKTRQKNFEIFGCNVGLTQSRVI